MAERKSAKRVAAGKKAAATRRRNASKTPVKRHRTTTTTTRKTTMLSEITSKANLRSGGEMIIQAAGGAFVANEIRKAMPNQTKLQRAGILAAIAYVAGVGMKMPAVGAGFAAVAAIEFFNPETNMQENGSSEVSYLEESKISELPDVVNMDENSYAYMQESQAQMQYGNPYGMYNY